MIRTVQLPGNHHYMLMGSEDIVAASQTPAGRKWIKFQTGIHSFDSAEFYHKSVVGDTAMVAESEKFFQELADQVPVSRGWRNIDDVVGAVPNVPALLAGHPQHMRRRERVMRETAPITIFMDLTSSMGIDRRHILRRGITLLALARLLIEHRSVELWVGTSLADRGVSGTVAWRIDTAPMDLARTAFHISDPSMSRLFGYAMCETMVDKHIGGGFLNYDQRMADLKEIAGWNEVMLIPKIHLYDEMVTNPIGWLKNVMSKYITEDAA